MRVARDVRFSEDEVVEWCRHAQDHNPLHLNKLEAEQHPIFEERIVPGMMFLDVISGLLTQWGEAKDGEVILCNIDDVAFYEPVALGQEVKVTVEENRQPSDDSYVLWFYVEDESTGYANGSVLVKVA